MGNNWRSPFGASRSSGPYQTSPGSSPPGQESEASSSGVALSPDPTQTGLFHRFKRALSPSRKPRKDTSKHAPQNPSPDLRLQCPLATPITPLSPVSVTDLNSRDQEAIAISSSSREQHPTDHGHLEPRDTLSRDFEVTPPSIQTNSESAIQVTVTKASETVWEKALKIANEKLNEKSLPPLDLNSLDSISGEENMRKIIKGLEAAHAEHKAKQLRYTWHGKEVIVAERLGNILRGLQKYSTGVSTAIQHHPEITSLIWAGVQTILQVTLNHLDALACLETTTAIIMEKMAICEVYAGIYNEMNPISSTKLQELLESALPKLYAAVLVFSVKARHYFVATWIKKIGNALVPFETDIQPFLNEITTQEKVIRECADITTMTRVKEMEDRIKPLIRLNNNDQICKLLKLLSPLEPLKRHQDIKLKRLENTCTWLLELDIFRGWSLIDGSTDKKCRIFCCYGIPGSGKTVMNSLVIDHLNAQLPNMGIACLYSDYRDQANQTFNHILGSFLRQFLALSHIPEGMVKTLEDIQKKDAKLDTAVAFDMLKIILQQFDGSFICIDALDELESTTRKQLLIKLKELITNATRLHLFFTGRKHIQAEIRRQFEIPKDYEVEIVASPEDIQKYLRGEIMLDPNPDAMDQALEDKIVTTLVERSTGMFLLPALHIKMVLGMTTIGQRRKALKTLPTGVYDTFGAVIDRIHHLSPNEADLAMRVLMWLHLAFRPLKLEELQHALSVNTDEVGTGPEETKFNWENIPHRNTFIQCCLGLVIVDDETGTVRFVHYTLEEYFRQHSNKYFPNGSITAATICLNYLNFEELSCQYKSETQLKENLSNFPFFEYATTNWGHYARRQDSDIVTALGIKLFEKGSRYQFCAVAYGYYRHLLPMYSWKSYDDNRRILGAHVAAFFGLTDTIKYYCSKQDMGMLDDSGRTPLSLAARGGHIEGVRLLLEREDVDVNAGVPLAQAAAGGHNAVVRLLLEREDVNINAGAPLAWAAAMGHEAVVRLLLEREDIDVNAKHRFGETPLDAARRKRHRSIEQLLLSAGASASDD